jgi:hypothetical protein
MRCSRGCSRFDAVGSGEFADNASGEAGGELVGPDLTEIAVVEDAAVARNTVP